MRRRGGGREGGKGGTQGQRCDREWREASQAFGWGGGILAFGVWGALVCDNVQHVGGVHDAAVCVYVCARVTVWLCLHDRVPAAVSVWLRVCQCACSCACVCLWLCVCVCGCTRACVRACGCVCVCGCVCMCVWLWLCVFVLQLCWTLRDSPKC